MKEDDSFIGDCSITMQKIEDEMVPEIGFHVIKDYCNKEYATEAALACKDYAFHSLNYSRIFLYSKLENNTSQKVSKKLGLQVYKTFEKNGQNHISHVLPNE